MSQSETLQAVQSPAAVGPSPETATVPIDIISIIRWMWIASLAVVGLGLVRVVLIEQIGTETIWRTLRMFDLDRELSMPAWYTSMLLWSAAFLLALHARLARGSERRTAPYWWALAAVFVFLSLDEMVTIHESAAIFLPDDFRPGGILTFRWVIVAAPLLVIGGLAFLPLLFRLPRSTALGIVAAGIVFVTGAFATELLGAYLSATGRDSVAYQLAVVVEEGLEIAGVSLFITVLLRSLAGLAATVAVRTTRSNGGTLQGALAVQPDPGRTGR